MAQAKATKREFLEFVREREMITVTCPHKGYHPLS